jgi:hypothetical protein
MTRRVAARAWSSPVSWRRVAPSLPSNPEQALARPRRKDRMALQPAGNEEFDPRWPPHLIYVLPRYTGEPATAPAKSFTEFEYLLAIQRLCACGVPERGARR